MINTTLTPAQKGQKIDKGEKWGKLTKKGQLTFFFNWENFFPERGPLKVGKKIINGYHQISDHYFSVSNNKSKVTVITFQ